MIEAKNLTFSYEEKNSIRTVLKNVSLAVEKGEWITILGRNGSGKTTLARCLNGLFLPDEGVVLVDGFSTADDEAVWEVRKHIAYVFQNPDNQIIGATVEEDIAFGPENLGMPVEEIHDRVEYSLKRLGLTELREQGPNLLSGGQKQKLAVAGCLAMNPHYLILDEATSMLDPISRKELYKTVRSLYDDSHIAVVNISHFSEEILWGQRVFLLDNGTVAFDGTTEEFLQNSSLATKYGLELPEIPALALALQERGINLPSVPLTKEEMVELLCL